MPHTCIDLGRLEKIEDLRSVWRNEASGFSKWLAEEENLALLGKTIGIEDLSLLETESQNGDFRVDLLCKDESTGNRVIIENQLEDSNHDHLGKIITYASGKDAKTIIWIVKHARNEHASAIKWLNEKTPIDVSFFLIEMELWKIGNSKIAPKFSIIEQPNNWEKNTIGESNLSELERLQLRFWQHFKDIAPQLLKGFTIRSACPQCFFDLSIGNSQVHVNLRIAKQKREITAGLYFRNCKEVYSKYIKNQSKVEAILGEKILATEGNKDCTIRTVKKMDITKESNWTPAVKWLCEEANNWKEVYEKFDL